MKKYKVYWSVWNLFEETQSEVIKLQNILKAFTVIISGGVWYTTNVNNAMYVAIIAFIADNIVGCLYFEKLNDKTKEQ
jgi:hypothetical protein